MASKTQPLPLSETQPHLSLNLRYQMVFAVTGAPQQFPAVYVPPGATITLRSVNGAALNVDGCSIHDYPEGVGQSGALFLPPGADVSVPWPVDNLNEIWAAGTEGDGLLVTVQANSVG